MIAGIVFLAVELRQNNELVEAAARDATNVRVADYIQQIYAVPGLAEITHKARSGEPLTEIDAMQLRGRQGRQLRGIPSSMERIRRRGRTSTKSINMETVLP